MSKSKKCRGCLSTKNPEELLPLFEDDRAELFTKCTKIKVKLNDAKSNWICPICLKKCIEWKNYQTERINNQNNFYQKIGLVRTYLKKDFECNQCDKRYDLEFQLKLHIELEHDENNLIDENNIVCKICDVKFVKMQAYKRHYHTHIFDGREKPTKKYTCEDCGLKYTCRESIRAHQKLHKPEQHYICELCGKTYYNTNRFKQHFITHSTEKPFECSKCGRRFKRNHHLLIHTRLLHGNYDPNVKTFKCKDCNKKFSTELYATLHHKKVHSAKTFQCSYCPKLFVWPSLVKKHEQERHHMTEGPFECDICKIMLKSRETLTAHMKIHDSSKQTLFTCEVCGKTMRNKNAMDYHRLCHTDERPFQCELCPKSYRQRFALNLHIKLQHLQEKKPKTERKPRKSKKSKTTEIKTADKPENDFAEII